MSSYIKLILELAIHTLSIVEKNFATKYTKKLFELERTYDEESDKDKPDRNVLDTIERDILRIGKLVNIEAKRQKAIDL